MKRPYETVLIVDGMLSDEKIDATVKSVEDFLTKNTELKGMDQRGKRRMAYSIKKRTHGHYTIFAFDGEGSVIADLERKLRLDESVLRFLTVSRIEVQQLPAMSRDRDDRGRDRDDRDDRGRGRDDRDDRGRGHGRDRY